MPFLRSSLRWKLVLPAIVTTAVTIVSFARHTAGEVSDAMEARETVHLVAVAEMLARDAGTIQAIRDQEVSRVRDSMQELLGLNPSIQRIEIHVEHTDGERGLLVAAGTVGRAILADWSGEESGVEVWRTDDAEGYLVATPIRESTYEDSWNAEAVADEASGTLLVWASREPIVRAMASYVRAVMPVGLGLLALAMTLGVFLTTKSLRRLRTLTSAAASFGRGSRDVRIPVNGHDEIAVLAHTFNNMVVKLDVSRARIEEQNRTLEAKVQERTRELLRAYEELQSLDKAKDSFLSSVSHELRTPLTSIRSFSEILLEYGDEEAPELRREFLTIIKDESERLSRLINQVLDLAKIEAGVMSWELSAFDFRELVETSVRALQGLKREKPVDFSVEIPDKPVPFFGDRDRMHQVLTNLITNAWKFSPENDSIEIALRRVDGGLEVRVADHGPGVPGEEEKERIFDRFRQGAHSLTDKPEGTGLGLPITKEILCMHGGFIACDDNAGGGALFLFLLPDPDPSLPRPIDEAIAADNGSWQDLSSDPRRSSIFDSSWAWAARASS